MISAEFLRRKYKKQTLILIFEAYDCLHVRLHELRHGETQTYPDFDLYSRALIVSTAEIDWRLTHRTKTLS